jgi:8-oxo-dGTP pyrophosphatase MutT (NUDIX family)
MTDPLFSHYPALAAEIERLCRRPPWRMTGASALVCTDEGLLLEIAKPRHWRTDARGVPWVGVGAIGGSLALDETLLECLQREALEELGTPLDVLGASEVGFCADESTVSRLRLAPGEHPLPCLFTVGANRYRASEIDAPWDRWADTVAALPLCLRDLCAVPGAVLETQGPLPFDAILCPVWTVHTLQQVLKAGSLEWPSATG